jgi:hypothetical protein
VSRRPTAATCESIRRGNLPWPRGVACCCGWCGAHTRGPNVRRLGSGARLCRGDQPQQRARALGVGTSHGRVTSGVAAGGAGHTPAVRRCAGSGAERGCVAETNRSNVRKHQAWELPMAAWRRLLLRVVRGTHPRSERAPARVRSAVVSRRPTAATCESIRRGNLPGPRDVGRCCGWCRAHTRGPNARPGDSNPRIPSVLNLLCLELLQCERLLRNR